MLEEMIEKSLLGKIRDIAQRKAGVYLLAGGLAVGGAYGCEEEPKPSEECCNEKNCSYDQVCDGDGDDCYCRKETCCESIGCSGPKEYCKTNEWDSSQCKCEYYNLG